MIINTAKDIPMTTFNLRNDLRNIWMSTFNIQSETHLRHIIYVWGPEARKGDMGAIEVIQQANLHL